MSYNQAFTDVKPVMSKFTDAKPVNSAFTDTKPGNSEISSEMDRLYPSTINVGEPMGLLLSLTYPNTFSFTTSFHP